MAMAKSREVHLRYELPNFRQDTEWLRRLASFHGTVNSCFRTLKRFTVDDFKERFSSCNPSDFGYRSFDHLFTFRGCSSEGEYYTYDVRIAIMTKARIVAEHLRQFSLDDFCWFYSGTFAEKIKKIVKKGCGFDSVEELLNSIPDLISTGGNEYKIRPGADFLTKPKNRTERLSIPETSVDSKADENDKNSSGKEAMNQPRSVAIDDIIEIGSSSESEEESSSDSDEGGNEKKKKEEVAKMNSRSVAHENKNETKLSSEDKEESSSDSDEDENQKKEALTKNPCSIAHEGVKKPKSSSEDEVESSSDSDEDDIVTKKKEYAAKKNLPSIAHERVTKPKSSSEDEEESSSDSDKETSVSRTQTSNTVMAKSFVKIKKGVASKSKDSTEQESSSDSEEETTGNVQRRKTTINFSKSPLKSQKGPANKHEDSSEEESSSSDDEETLAEVEAKLQKKNPVSSKSRAIAQKGVATKSKDSTDEESSSSSSSDDVHKSVKQNPVKAVTAAQKRKDSTEESSSSDDNHKNPKQKPVNAVVKARPLPGSADPKKNESSSTDKDICKYVKKEPFKAVRKRVQSRAPVICISSGDEKKPAPKKVRQEANVSSQSPSKRQSGAIRSRETMKGVKIEGENSEDKPGTISVDSPASESMQEAQQGRSGGIRGPGSILPIALWNRESTNNAVLSQSSTSNTSAAGNPHPMQPPMFQQGQIPPQHLMYMLMQQGMQGGFGIGHQSMNNQPMNAGNQNVWAQQMPFGAHQPAAPMFHTGFPGGYGHFGPLGVGHPPQPQMFPLIAQNFAHPPPLLPSNIMDFLGQYMGPGLAAALEQGANPLDLAKKVLENVYGNQQQPPPQ